MDFGVYFVLSIDFRSLFELNSSTLPGSLGFTRACISKKDEFNHEKEVRYQPVDG